MGMYITGLDWREEIGLLKSDQWQCDDVITVEEWSVGYAPCSLCVKVLIHTYVRTNVPTNVRMYITRN